MARSVRWIPATTRRPGARTGAESSSSSPEGRMRARRSLLGLTLLTTGACVFPQQVQQLEKSVAEVQQKLAQVEKTQAESKQELDAIQAKLGDGAVVTRQEFADLKVQVDEVARGVATAQEGIQDANRRMDRLSQDVAASRDASRRMAAPIVVPADPGAAPGAAPGGSQPVPSP